MPVLGLVWLRPFGPPVVAVLLCALLFASGCSTPVEYGPDEQGEADTAADSGEQPTMEAEVIAPPLADAEETPLPPRAPARPSGDAAGLPLPGDSTNGQVADQEGANPGDSNLPAALLGGADSGGPPAEERDERSTDEFLNDIFGPAEEDAPAPAQAAADEDTNESAFGDFLMGDSDEAPEPPAATTAEETAPVPAEPEVTAAADPMPEPEPAEPTPAPMPVETPTELPPFPALEEPQPTAAQPEDEQDEPVQAETEAADLGWSPLRPTTPLEQQSPGQPVNGSAEEMPEPAPALTPKRPTLDVSNTRRLAWMLGAKLSLTLAPEAKVESWEADAIAQTLHLDGAEIDSSGSLPQRAARLLKTAGALGADLAKKQSPAHAALFEIAVKSNAIATLYDTHPRLAPNVASAIESAADRAGIDRTICQPIVRQLRQGNASSEEVRAAVFDLHRAMDAALAGE